MFLDQGRIPCVYCRPHQCRTKYTIIWPGYTQLAPVVAATYSGECLFAQSISHTAQRCGKCEPKTKEYSFPILRVKTISSFRQKFARPFGLIVTNLKCSPPISNYIDLITVTVREDTPGKRSCIMQSITANTTIHTLLGQGSVCCF